MLTPSEGRPAGAVVPPGSGAARIGDDHVGFDGALAQLSADYPAFSPAHIEFVLLREWEAFTGGRPTAVPTAVEDGAREVLDGQS